MMIVKKGRVGDTGYTFQKNNESEAHVSDKTSDNSNESYCKQIKDLRYDGKESYIRHRTFYGAEYMGG